MAPAIPNAVPTDDNASLRWCQAFASNACEDTSSATFFVTRNITSFVTMLSSAASNAIIPGDGSVPPFTTYIMSFMPFQASIQPTIISASAISEVARVSYLPCP